MTCCAVPELHPRPRPAASTAGRLAACLLLTAAVAACASGAAKPRATSAELLTNPELSPEYSQWLVGPAAELATPEEVDRYLALADDAAAAAFVEEFWARRNPYPERPDNPLREKFEERAAEADRLFSESGYLGRRTARGTVFILHGPPEEVDYQVAEHALDPPVTLWRYAEGAPPGLDGKPPDRLYRFIRRGDITEFYVPRRGPSLDPDDPRSRRRPY